MNSIEQAAKFSRVLKLGPWVSWFKDKEFSKDWSTHNFPRWMRVLAPVKEQVFEVLEIGSHEGRSAIFWLRFLPQSKLTCVDPFKTTKNNNGPLIERRFDANTAGFGERLTKIKSSSAMALSEFVEAGRSFDLIYIDGSHRRDDVMVDSLLAWSLLREGGFIIFDDYELKLELAAAERPKDAIDCFLEFHASELEIIARGYQIIVQRRPSNAIAGAPV